MRSKRSEFLKQLLYAENYGASGQTARRIVSVNILKARQPSSVSFYYDAESKTVLVGEAGHVQRP